MFWGVLARTAAWINLFNLTPVWQLDGSRGFHALSLALASAWRTFEKQPDRKPDWPAFAMYAALLIACCGFLPIPHAVK